MHPVFEVGHVEFAPTLSDLVLLLEVKVMCVFVCVYKSGDFEVPYIELCSVSIYSMHILLYTFNHL